jgi:hypothetical protein
MLKINFYPESDLNDYEEAVKFFEEFWRQDGEKITNKWEEISGFKFWETEINAVVGNFVSHSHPLSLNASKPDELKKVILVHELGHRLLIKRIKGKRLKAGEETHKFLYLLLKDVLVELYGDEAFQTAFDFDMKLSREFGKVEYENAWKWVLQYETKEERQKVFKQIIEGELEL